jgi:hypothetical protein
MEVTFNEPIQLPAAWDGNVNLELTAGTRFQIRNNETGDIMYNVDETVPVNKVWNVCVSLSIKETDV